MSKRKAFIFAPLAIYPAVMGNQKDIHGHVELFRELGFDTTLLCTSDPGLESTTSAEGSIGDLKTVKIPKLITGNRSRYTYWNRANELCSREAISVIQGAIDAEKPDVLFFEYAYFAYPASLLEKGKAKMIFRAHNFELMHSYEKGLLGRKDQRRGYLGFLMNAFKTWHSIYCNEKLMCKISSRVFSISYVDCYSFRRWYGADNVIYFPPYLPNTVADYAVRDRSPLNVLYMGSDLSSSANVRGAIYILEKVVPKMNRRSPSKFVFHIIGKEAHVLSRYTPHKNLRIRGFVPDINSFLKNMDIAILPVKAGRGCKIKMFECLAAGIPTIGFKKTFHGIPWTEGCFDTAENPWEFAQALDRMQSVDYRRKVSHNAKAYIHKLASRRVLLSRLRRCVDNY